MGRALSTRLGAAMLLALIVPAIPAGEAAAQESPILCEAFETLATDDPDTAELVADLLELQCPNLPADLIDRPGDAAAAIAGEAAALAEESADKARALAGFALVLDPDNEAASAIVDPGAVPPAFDACDLAATLRRDGEAASAAALAAAVGEDCKLTVTSQADAAAVLLAAAEAELAGDDPDREKARRLIAAATAQAEAADLDETSPLRERIGRVAEDAADPPFESLRDDVWAGLADGAITLGLLAAGFLLLWFLSKLVGQLDTPSRWWRWLADSPTFAGRLAGGRSARWLLLVIGLGAIVLATAVAIGGGWWRWVLACAALVVGFVAFSLWVHGPHVRFKVEPFGDEDGGLAELLSAYVRELGSSEAPVGLEAYQAPDDAVEQIPDAVGKLAPGDTVSALAGLATSLVPDRSFKLSGDVHVLADSYELSLTLEQGHRVVDSIVVNAGRKPVPKDEDPAKPIPKELRRLARVGAVWVSLSLSEATGRVMPIYGSTNWRSAALTATAMHAPASEKQNTALLRQRLVLALERDPENRAASFQLGLLDLQALDHETAVRRLRQRLPARPGTRPDRYEWYRTAYNLAVAHFNAYLCYRGYWAGSPNPLLAPGHLGNALAVARELYSEVEEYERWYGNQRSPSDSDCKLYEYLVHSTRKPTAVLLADIQQEADRIAPADRAPYYTGNLIAFAEAGTVTARTHYNLACFHANRRNHDQALQHLTRALEDPSHRAWAPLDPGLYVTRVARRTSFEKTLGGAKPPEAAKPALAGFGPLTDAQARTLWTQDPPVTDPSSLARTCATRRQRWEVTEKTGIDDWTLLSAALLGDLVTQIPATKRFIADLYDAGLGSIALLQSQAGAGTLVLRDKLGGVPDPNTIAGWLAHAQAVQPRVVP